MCPLCRQIIQASPALLRTNLDLQAALRSRSSSSSSSNLSSGYTSGSSSGCDGSVLRISNNISSSGSSSSSSSFRSSCASKKFLKKLQPSSASASASPAATNAAASLWSSTLLLALLVLFSAVAFSRLDGPAAARIRVVARPPSRDDQGLCAVYAEADEVTGSRGSGGSSGNLNFLSAAASNYEHSSSSSGGGSGSCGGDMRAYAGVGGAGVNTFDALAGAHMTQPPPPPPTPPRRVPAAKMLALLRSLSPSPQFRQADATATTTSAERSLPSVPTGASPALAHSSNTATAAAAVSTITAALRHHGRNGAVVREACAALRRSVLDDADARDAFAKGHGVGLVVALLRPSNGYIANFNLGVGAPPTNAAAALVYEVAATLKVCSLIDLFQLHVNVCIDWAVGHEYTHTLTPPTSTCVIILRRHSRGTRTHLVPSYPLVALRSCFRSFPASYRTTRPSPLKSRARSAMWRECTRSSTRTRTLQRRC